MGALKSLQKKLRGKHLQQFEYSHHSYSSNVIITTQLHSYTIIIA